MTSGVYVRTEEGKHNLSLAHLGKKLSESHKEKISSSLIGRTRSQEHILNQSGGKSGTWKGDQVKYSALHEWVRKHFGTPAMCESCQTIVAKKYEWSNKSGKYLRDRSDWQRLCTSCHRKYDRRKGGKTDEAHKPDKPTSTG